MIGGIYIVQLRSMSPAIQQ